ncbi:hypothetical protein chiPu_0028321 [Chiloscyllium punctatum]|uniref:Uncharacterized protein n=1 Tax=Chiloscyllium punctatum TaxID=137246 RepID=A0A401TMV4_CHIPU|nr:hypothetical protein [Chiloscyllium punctatum]
MNPPDSRVPGAAPWDTTAGRRRPECTPRPGRSAAAAPSLTRSIDRPAGASRNPLPHNPLPAAACPSL